MSGSTARAEVPDRLTAEQLALETQTDVDGIAELAQLGLIAPSDGRYAWADIYRVRMVRSLEAAGMPLERLAEAFSSGRLSMDFLEVIMSKPSPRTGRTFAQFADSLGDRRALVGEVYEMLGLAHPPADTPMREDEETIVREMIELWAEDPQILKRAARVAGLAIRSVVEGWVSLHYELYRALGGGGRESWPAELREREPAMAGRAVRLAEHIPSWLTLRHYEQVVYSDVIENIELQIDPYAERRSDAPGVRQPAIVFIDLSGFTAMTEAEGDDLAVAATARFEEVVARVAPQHRGRVVKTLGDGALLLFPDAAAAVSATARIRAGLADLPLELHAGIDCGPVAERDGDVFGRTVNMASRLATAARDGQVLISAGAAAAAGLGEAEAQSVGALTLKGVDRAVPAFELAAALAD